MLYFGKQFQPAWEAIRKHGRRRFILIFGVLQTGLILALVSLLASSIGTNITNGDALFAARGFSETFQITTIMLTFVVYVLAGGYIFGHFTWKMYEQKYLRLTAGVSNQPGT